MYQEKEAEAALAKFIRKHPAGEDDKKAPEFYQAIAQSFNFSKQKVAFIVVPHMVHTLPYFLQALTPIGAIAAIIPKASQYVPTVLETLKEIYESIIYKDIDKLALRQKPIIHLFLQSICEQYPEHKLMILDHGGYFAPRLDILQIFSAQIAGIVEHTWNGHLKYQEKLQAIPSIVPIFSIALSRLKAYEDLYVASSIINALSANILGGSGLSQELSRLKIGIIGYGHMGEAVAKELSKRIRQEDIMICDTADARLEQAQRFGYKCSKEISPLLSECNVIIAAASTQILGRAEFSQMNTGACVVCVTSGDDQFKPDYLVELEKVGATPFVTTYKRPSGDNIHFACDGRSVNFSIGSTPHPVLHAVLASLSVAAFSCLTIAPTAQSAEIKELSEGQVLVIKEIYEERFGSIDEVEVLINRLREQAQGEIAQDSAMVQGFDLFVPPRATNIDISKVKDYPDYTYDLCDEVAKFLLIEQSRVLLLQANAGSSKTLFSRQLEQLLFNCYNHLDPIPLFIALPQIRHLDGDLVVQALENKGFNPREIELLKAQEFLIILDGFDEIKGKPNLIIELSTRYRGKIIVTSRLGHLNDGDEPLFKANDREIITKIYITPFNEARVLDYIKRYADNPVYNTNHWSAERYKEVLDRFPELKELTKEPLILQLALSALPLLEHKQRITRYDIYQVATISYSRRQFEKLKLAKGEKLKDYSVDDAVLISEYYAGRLAFRLCKNNEQVAEWREEEVSVETKKSLIRLKLDLRSSAVEGDEDKPDEYKDFFEAASKVERGQQKLSQQVAPIKKLAEYKITFLHKSFQEYYFAKMVLDELRRLVDIENPDEFVKFIESCWLNQRLITLNEPSIVRFICDNISQPMLALPEEHGQEAVSACGTAAAAQDALREHGPLLWLRRQLFKIVDASKITHTISVASANAITTLNLAGVNFSHMDFSDVKIPHAELVQALCYETQFQRANLTQVNFHLAFLDGADFSGAKMRGVRFGERVIKESYRNLSTCAYYPDGKLLAVGEGTGEIASGTHQNTIHFWSLGPRWNFDGVFGGSVEVSHVLLTNGEGHTTSMAFSPDGALLVSGSIDGTLSLWDVIGVVKTSELDKISISLGKSFGGMSCSDGKSMYTPVSGPSYSLPPSPPKAIINISTTSLERHTKAITSVVFSSDGEILASGSLDGTIRLWRFVDEKWNLLRIINCHDFAPEEKKVEVCRVAFSSKRTFLAAVNHGAVYMWDSERLYTEISTGERCLTITGMQEIAFSSDGELVASTSCNTIYLWNISSRCIQDTLKGHSNAITTILFSQNGKLLASGSINVVCIWDIASAQVKAIIAVKIYYVKSVSFSPDGEKLAVVGNCNIEGNDKERSLLQILDVVGPCVPSSLPLHMHGKVTGLSFSSSLGLFATSDKQGVIYLWDAISGRVVTCLKSNSGCSGGEIVIFSPCGKTLAASSWDGTVMLWSIVDNNLWAPWMGDHSEDQQLISTKKAKSIAFSPCGNFLVNYQAN